MRTIRRRRTGSPSKKLVQAARRTAAARPISAVPISTIAAWSGRPAVLTRWTAMAGVTGSLSLTDGAAISGVAANVHPVNTREARY